MSENVLSHGFMAVLKTPAEDFDEFSDMLDEAKSILHVNYEGTIVYSDDGGDEFEAGLMFGSTKGASEFLSELKSLKIEIDETKILPYSCVWYNGSDSYMADLELDDYLKNF